MTATMRRIATLSDDIVARATDLIRQAGAQGRSCPSNAEFIAAGLSPDTFQVKPLLNALEDSGYITVSGGSRRRRISLTGKDRGEGRGSLSLEAPRIVEPPPVPVPDAEGEAADRDALALDLIARSDGAASNAEFVLFGVVRHISSVRAYLNGMVGRGLIEIGTAQGQGGRRIKILRSQDVPVGFSSHKIRQMVRIAVREAMGEDWPIRFPPTANAVRKFERDAR